MKQTVKMLFLLAFAFITPKHDPVGHWQITYTNGASEFVDFNKDGSFQSHGADGKASHQGSFKFHNDVISINDKEGCGDTYWGSYKLTFYTEDSVLNTVMEDSCTGRKDAVNGSVLKRMTR
jgi:hypothetical protein